MIEDYIKTSLSKFTAVLDFHENIFGIEDSLNQNEYLNLKNEILTLVNLFSFMDKSFEDPLILKYSNDIVSTFKFFSTLEATFNVNQIYNDFPQKARLEKDAFKKIFMKVMREQKMRAIKILNTKIFYFDLLVWDKANSSQEILKLIRGFGVSKANTTKEFLSQYEGDFKNTINTEFTIKKVEITTKYNHIEIEKIKSLLFKEKAEIDTTIEKLIASKKSIKLFKGMSDDDIREVVKNVKFIHYEQHESIVNIGDIGKEIYFILKGSCRVSVGNQNVGKLLPQQIFGEFGPILKEPRGATVKANEQVTVISFELAFEHYKKDPFCFTVLFKNLIDELIAKIRMANSKKF